MKRLLVLAPNPETAASTRFRLSAFFPALREAGIEPILRPFLDEAAFAMLYTRGAPFEKLKAASHALLARLTDLVRASRAQAVLIHREAALVGPPVIEWVLTRALRLPTIFDFDDAIWVPYESPTYGAFLSRLLKAPDKTAFSVRASTRVFAGNAYLADWAGRLNANVDVFPTIVDTDLFRPRSPRNEVPVLGWIGTHSTGRYLEALVAPLRRLARRRRFSLRVIGAPLEAVDLPIELREWSLAREADDFAQLDVGLYPLIEDAWSVGKSGFKAVQYMACGVPVVASPVGVTREMIRNGVNGFLAEDDAQWESHLERLIDDAGLRARIGQAGRADAVERWSLAAHAPRWVQAVSEVMSSRNGA